MHHIWKLSTAALLSILFITSTALPAEQGGMKVMWNKDYTSVSAAFRGKRVAYPASIAGQSKAFPQPGEKPRINIQSDWPNFTMVAQWSATTKGWPKEYRNSTLDYALMYACDAGLMHKLFPEMIREGEFTAPAEFRKKAADPKGFNLVQALRGREVKYQVLAKAGLGAPDYTIKTQVRIGLSEDNKTVFSYDAPDYISANLKLREILFAAHDAGDRTLFELRVVCVCAPRRVFRSVAMERIQDGNKYFVEQLYALSSHPPTRGELVRYSEVLKKADIDLHELMDTNTTPSDSADDDNAMADRIITRVTGEIRLLLAEFQQPPATGEFKSLIDHVFWRAATLLVIVFVLAMGYRWTGRRRSTKA